MGRLRANAFGELYLEDDLGSVRVVADEPGLLQWEMLGRLVVVRRFDLVVEKLPYFEVDGDSNPYVAESQREKAEKARRTLEKQLRYVRLETATVTTVAHGGEGREKRRASLQALLLPRDASAANKHRRKARTTFLVTRVMERELTPKGKVRFCVNGFPILDDMSPLQTDSEALVTFTTTCVPCFKGRKCHKLHSTAAHALLQPGRCYSIPCHRDQDGTFLANYCDALGMRPLRGCRARMSC